jgi:hypothetical protein
MGVTSTVVQTVKYRRRTGQYPRWHVIFRFGLGMGLAAVGAGFVIGLRNQGLISIELFVWLLIAIILQPFGLMLAEGSHMSPPPTD